MTNFEFQISNSKLTKRIKSAIFISLCLNILVSLYPNIFISQANAASFDISASPPIFQIELTPPANVAVDKQIVLENSSDDPTTLQVIYRHFKPTDENGVIQYRDEKETPGNDPDILKRITLLDEGQPVNVITIPPKSTKKYDLKISIPKNEPPSDYYFSILFVSDIDNIVNKTTDNDQPSNSKAQGGVGINVLLSIGPKGTTTGTIEEFSTPFFQSGGPVPFIIRVKNSSQHFIAPKGTIEIKNMFGQRIGLVTLLPVDILSGMIRSLPSREQFVFESDKQSGKADKKTQQKIEDFNEKFNKNGSLAAIWPESFLLGPYSANLTIALSDEGPIFHRSIVFIGFPTILFFVIIIATITLVSIRARLIHREKNL